jgi:predicted Fe-S protein YdhL (DUF1289 family)
MSDEVWKRDEIDSPCQKVCLIQTGAETCIGCFRTRREIALWSRMTPDERRDIMAELPARGEAMKPKRRGREARLRGSE